MVKPLQKKATRCKSPASNQGGPKTVEVYKHFEPSKTNLFSRKPYRYKEFDFPTVIPPEVEVANVDYRGLKQQEGRSLENSFKDATLHERTRSNRNQKLKSITDTNLTVSNALRLMENRIKANMENLKKRESLINPKLGKSDMKSKNLNVKNDGIRRPFNLNTKFNQDGDAGNISGGQPFINKGKDVAKIGKTASGLLYDVDEFIHLNSAHRLYRDYMYNNWGTEEEEEVPKKSLSASSYEAQRSSQLRSSVVSTCQNANKKRTVNQDGRRENNEGSNADIGNEYSVIFEEPDTLPLQKQIDRDLAQSVSNTQLVYKKLTAEDKRTNSVSPRMKMNEEDMKTRLKELKLELCENRCNKLQDCTSETTSRRINLRGEANQGLQGKENNLRTPLTSQKVKEAEYKTSVLKKNLEPVQTHCETTSDQFNKGQTSTSSTSKDKVKQELERIEKNSCKTLTSQKVKETETDLIEKVSCKTSTRESKSSIEIKSDSLQSNDANKVIHSGFARTSSTNTCLLLPDVVALRNELDTTKQTCHEEIRKSVKELRSEIAQYRQALNINVNIVSGKLLPESGSGVSSPEETTRSHVEDDILKTKKTEDEHEPTDSTGRTLPIHNFSDSDVHDESSRIKRTRSNLFEVDRSVKKSQSELMISPNTEFSEQFKHEDHLPKNNREEIAYNSTEIDKPELVNYQETLEMSVLRTKKSATRQQLSKQSTKLEPKKNLSKPPECEEVKTDNKVRGGVTLPVSVNGISFPCKEIDKCGDELTTNLQNMLDVLKLSLQLQSQIDENKRFHNTPSYDLQNIADFDEVICNLNGLIKSVELEHEVTETDISGKLTSKVVDCGINTKNVAELKSSEDNQENQGKTSDASCCENMRNHMNMLMQVLQQSKEDHRNEMKKTAEIIRQEFGHYKQQVVAYNMESSQKGSKCGKLNTKKLRERSCCLAPGTTCAAAPRTESPVPEKKVRLSLDLPDSDQKKGKCGCKGTFVEICACREKADKTSGKHREKNEDEKRCHLFGCANPTISVQQDEKKPEPDKASREQTQKNKPEQISSSSSSSEKFEIVPENKQQSENESDNPITSDQNKPDEVLLTVKTSSSSLIDSLPNQLEIMESATPTVSEKVDDEETDLNKISEEAEESPLLEPEPPAKKLIVQHMPQISIRPPLTLHKIFDIEIRPTGSFSYRSPDFRNIHYEEIYSPLTKSTGQQTSSTLLKKAEKADRICSCGPQDIKADLVQIPIQSIPDSESAKLSSEELTKAKSAELTKSDTDTVKSVSELSGRTSSIDTDSETRGSSVTEKTKRASSSPTPDSVLQKTVKPPSRPESLEKPLRLDSKTEKRRVSKTIPPESDSKQLLKTKLDSKKELVEKLAAEKPTEPVEQEFVSRSASLPPVDIVAVKMFTSSAKSSFLNEVGIIKITPEKVDIFEISSMKTFQKAAEIGPKSIGAKKLSAIEETKEPEIGTCASIVQDCTCSSPDLQCNVKKLGATEETKMGTCATLVQDCKCSSDDVQCNGKETSAERYEAIDIHKDKFPVHFTQDNQLASIDSSVQNGKDAKVNQLTGLLDTSRAILSESEPNIKYMNEAYREQTVSEKQFGPHPESSASAYSVPEKETEPPSASKTKIHFNKDDKLKCQCNLVSDASVSEENPVTSSNPDIPLQKSSESVYVLTHDISIQSSPTHIPVATKSVPVKRKSLGEKRNSSGRGAKMRQPRKRSTFKSPVSSKISYLTKSNEKSLTLVQGTALKGSATQRQGNSKKTNNLSKPRSQEATEVERPNSRSRVSTPEASKRHDVIPEETIPEQDYHSPTVMSVAVQYQMQKSLVDVLYPRLHKSRNCKDLDTSSSEFDGYRKLGKNKLSDDTEDSSINPYKMYCGDSIDYMRRYQKNEGGDVNNGKIKKVIRRPAQTISFSSASNSASHRLEESLSEGEIRCKCSISIGELHICRYVQQIKERAKVSRRKQDDSSSCRKWVNSKSDSSTKIDASTTEPSSDT